MNNLKTLVVLFSLIIVFGCTRICNDLESRDVVGYYYPEINKEGTKEHIQINSDGSYTHFYCSSTLHILDTGNWHINKSECTVTLKEMRWFDTGFPEHENKSYVVYLWDDGLTVNFHVLDFYKSRKRPDVNCPPTGLSQE